jgi:hypothetical protein
MDARRMEELKNWVHHQGEAAKAWERRADDVIARARQVAVKARAARAHAAAICARLLSTPDDASTKGS